MNPQGQRPGFGTIARDARLTPTPRFRPPSHRSPMHARPSYSCRWRVRTPATAVARRARSAKAEARRECRRPGLARAIAQCGERRDRHRHGGRSQRQRGTSARPAERRPRGAMDPVDPRGQPQRPDLAIRGVPDRGLPPGICRDGRDHVVAGQAGMRKDVAGRITARGELQAAE